MPFGIPTEFGISFFFRTFLPGLITSLLIFYSLLPAYPGVFELWTQLSLEQTAAVLTVSGLLIGMVITANDYAIYTFYEGRFGWPAWLKKRLTARLARKVASLHDRNSQIENESDALKMRLKMETPSQERNQILTKLRALDAERNEIWSSLRGFPSSPSSVNDSSKQQELRREARFPTLLGNIFAEGEDYPLIRYGIDPVFYWYRLTQVVPKDNLQALDKIKATSDFLIYTSTILAFYGPIYLITYFAEQLYPSALGVGLTALALSYILYRMSLGSLREYSEYTKSLYDVYRAELKKMLLEETTTENVNKEMDFWERHWRYLQYGMISETKRPSETNSKKINKKKTA